MERMGLTEDQIKLLTDALEKESRLRRIMESENIRHIEPIMKLMDTETLDLSSEDLIREKLRIEYEAFIPREYRSLTSGVMKNSIKSY